MEGYTIADLEGEKIIKLAGSITGETVNITRLSNCQVYILDSASDINVTECSKCKIFVGPVDGLALFENVRDSQVAVASSTFRAKDCHRVDFEVLTSSGPIIEESRDIRFAKWQATYPKFDEHLARAALDLEKNAWDQVYDSTSADFGHPNFLLEEPLAFLQPPDITGMEVVEEAEVLPVPAPIDFDDSAAEYVPGESPLSMPAENGHAAAGFFEATNNIAPAESFRAPPPLDQLPTVIAAKEQLKERLAKQEAAEAKARDELLKNATNFIEDFYKKRSALKAQRSKENRAAAKNLTAKGPEGKTEWERTANLIDFQFARANGADLSRFKGVLFAAKAKAGGK